MKLKRILLLSTVALSITSTSTYAFIHRDFKGEKTVPAPVVLACQPTCFTGFYLGGSLGVINNDFSYNDNNDHTIDQGEVSPTAELFGGYRYIFRHRYSVGAEIFGNSTLGDASTNTTVPDHTNTHVKVRTSYSYGFSLLPGILLNERTLGYLRIGAVGTRFEATVNYTDPQQTRASNDETRAGLGLGFGLETNIYCHLDLRLDYVHTYYRSLTTTVDGYRIHPSNDRVNLGLIYKFA